MLEPIKGRPGCFLDTVIVDVSYTEVAPRRFERVVNISDWRVESHFHVVTQPVIKDVGRLQGLWAWLLMRLGRRLVTLGDRLMDLGAWLRNRGWKILTD